MFSVGFQTFTVFTITGSSKSEEKKNLSLHLLSQNEVDSAEEVEVDVDIF